MVRRSPDDGRLSETWRDALFGGVASMPVTAALYWLSGGGREFPLDAVAVAGLVAGYLAAGRAADPDAVGLRAGVVGGLPGVAWLLAAILGDATALSGPAWFEVAGLAFVVGATSAVAALVLALAAVVGVLGARVGGWVAARRGRRVDHAG